MAGQGWPDSWVSKDLLQLLILKFKVYFIFKEPSNRIIFVSKCLQIIVQ